MQQNTLTQLQTQSLTARIPPFEISYETIAHKKFFPSYNLALAIPNGKKYYAYFSFYQGKNVCYLMELNREKKIVDVTFHDNHNHDLSLGTLLYGTLIQHETNPNDSELRSTSFSRHESFPPTSPSFTTVNIQVFVVEDAYYYKGISLKNMVFGEKLGYIEQFMETVTAKKNGQTHPPCRKAKLPTELVVGGFKPPDHMIFVLPRMWGINHSNPDEPSVLEEYEEHKPKIQYAVHHIQLRKLMEISPFINISINHLPNQRRDNKESTIPSKIQENTFTINFGKPQYRYPTVFQVSADIQFDIYHLFACGKNKTPVYYGITYISNIKTSFMMNKLFRNIRENINIDYIEESDDEDDFENIAEDKYVDLNKTVKMECVFHQKFKKWVPIRVITDPAIRIIHISKLVNE